MTKARLSMTLLAAMAASTSAGWAAVQGTSRTTTFVIDPGGSSFVGASGTSTTQIGLNNSAGSLNQTVNLLPLATSIQVSGTGGANTSVSSAADFTTSFPVTITSPGGSGVGWQLGFQIGAGTTSGQSPLTDTIVGGLHQLSLFLNPSGFIVNGSPYTATVEILGDWSGSASHTTATHSAGYTVLDDFVFDGTYTRYSVQNTNFQGSGPSISFSLVPEPGTMAVLSVGLLGAGIARRRARRG